MPLFTRRNKGGGGPPWWQAYESLDWSRIRRRTPVEALRFVVLDTETTGTDARRDRLLSVSAIGIEKLEMQIGRTLELVVHQDSFAGGPSVPVHGIKPEDSKAGLPEAEALRRVLAFVENRIIVGHRIGFDLRVLNEGLGRMGLGELRNKWLDTAQLGMRAEHLFPNPYIRQDEYSLDALCNRYHVRPRYRHTASGDVFITGILLLKLLGKLRTRGAVTWGQIR